MVGNFVLRRHVSGAVKRNFLPSRTHPTDPFLDLYLTISDGCVSSQIYDKRDYFYFDIVNFPFVDWVIPRAASYGGYISQLIRFAIVSSHVADFNLNSETSQTRLSISQTPKSFFKILSTPLRPDIQI